MSLLEQILPQLRALCMPLAEAREAVQFGHPAFLVHGRMFAVLEEWKGQTCLVVKVGRDAMGVFLEDPRYFTAPYIGKHGWVSLRLDSGIDWDEVAELVRGSHALVLAATPKMAPRKKTAIRLKRKPRLR